MKTHIVRLIKTDLFKASFLNGIANIIKILTGLVSNKVVAIYLGPSGIALLGQFQNFSSIIMNLANFGINSGVTKYIAENAEYQKNRKEIISTSFFIVTLGAILASFAVYFSKNYLSEKIFKTNVYESVFVMFSFTLILFVLNSLFIAILNGFKQFNKIVIANISSSCFGVVIAIILVIKFGVIGAFMALILSQTLVFFVTLTLVLKSEWFSFSTFFAHFKFMDLKKLGKYSLMTLVSVFTVTVVQLQIRNYIITNFNLMDAGFWQGVIRICDLYTTFIITTLSVYYLPRLSELKTNVGLFTEIRKGYIFILPLVVITSVFVYLLRTPIINLLFASDFSPMENLFLFQIIGNIFKISSWLLAYLMLAKAMMKTYIITEIIFGLNYYLLTIYFLNEFGLVGSTYAYSLNYFMYLITIIVIFRNIFLRSKPNSI